MKTLPQNVYPMSGNSYYAKNCAIILLTFSAAASLAHAQDATVRTFDSGGGNNNWTTATNWSSDLTPTAAEVASWATTSSTQMSINFGQTTNAGTQTNGNRIQEVGALNIASNRTATSLTIGNSSGTAGATGTLRLMGVTLNGTANTIIRNNDNSSLTIQNIIGTGTSTMRIELGNTTNNIISIDSTGNVNISSVIIGVNRNLTLQGGGTGRLILSGANTYSGTTTISTGGLQIGNGSTTGRLSATTSITNDANLTINRSDAFSQATDLGAGVAITGTGSFTQAGAGTTTLTAANTYTGNTTVSAGTLSLGASNVLPDASAIVLSGGTLLTGNTFTETAKSLSLTAASTITMGLDTGTSVLTFAEGVAGTSGISTTQVLSVWNWNGSLSGGVNDQLFLPVGSLNSTELAGINFYSGAGTGLINGGGALQLGTGELVPVPEPGALASALALAGTALFRRRRQA